MNKYEPLPCEICKMCYLDTNFLYDSGRVICNKYEIEVSHWRENFGGINHHVYNRLYERCRCNKHYPSKWKIFKFKIKVYFRMKANKKYHRDEV